LVKSKLNVKIHLARIGAGIYLNVSLFAESNMRPRKILKLEVLESNFYDFTFVFAFSDDFLFFLLFHFFFFITGLRGIIVFVRVRPRRTL
jgi:uncharacterized membrane protein HdeD (DUF308 family)